MPSRRMFLLGAVPIAANLMAASAAFASPPNRLEETDPLAAALGYKRDATKVDGKKYPTFAPDRHCSKCQLFAAKAGEPWGVCSAVGGKLVSAKGWCVAWVKKTNKVG